MDLTNKNKIYIIVILILACTIVVIIEEWFTNSQLNISSSLTLSSQVPDIGGSGSNDSKLKSYPARETIRLTQDLISEDHFRGSKKLVKCSHYKFAEHACPTNWRQYLTFLSLTGFFGGIFGILTRYRQYQLRCRTLARFRKQDDLDESRHTLIDMDTSF